MVICIVFIQTDSFGIDDPIPPKIMIGVQGGYSQHLGHYGNSLNNAPTIGFHVIPYSFWYIFGEIDFNYSVYSLQSSSKSKMFVYTIGIGPVLYYPLSSYFDIYLGVSFQYSFINLNAVLSNQNERTYKPGFNIKAGFIIPIRWGINLRLGVTYAMNELSGEIFQNINYRGGITYNFYSLFERTTFDPENIENIRYAKIDKLYRSGVRNMNQGKITGAKFKFNEVLKINPGHKDAKRYHDLIVEKESAMQSAIELINKKQYYKALPVLEDASIILPAAKNRLKKVRVQLKKGLNVLQKNGIKAYEQKKYQQCISIMRKIKLIEPNNRTVKIYLPRAVKRYEALKRLK